MGQKVRIVMKMESVPVKHMLSEINVMLVLLVLLHFLTVILVTQNSLVIQIARVSLELNLGIETFKKLVL